jgi:integrase/recombinase XerD
MAHYLYFAPNKDGSAFKIGFSIAPDSRLNIVEGDIDYPKTYLFECKNKASMKAVEDFSHKYFEDFKVEIYEGDGKTEWFDISIFKVAINTLLDNRKILGIVNHFKFKENFTEKKKRPRAERGILTEEELVDFMDILKADRLGLRNAAILATSHYLGYKVSQIAPLNIEDAVKNLDGIKNQPFKDILKEYIDQRKEQDGTTFNMKAPLFRSQRGMRLTPGALARALLLLYKKNGYPDCSSETGRKSALARSKRRYEEAIDKFE